MNADKSAIILLQETDCGNLKLPGYNVYTAPSIKRNEGPLFRKFGLAATFVKKVIPLNPPGDTKFL